MQGYSQKSNIKSKIESTVLIKKYFKITVINIPGFLIVPQIDKNLGEK